jgi:long-chain-alcohol oxidase
MAAALLRRSVRIQEPAPPPYVYGLGPGILSGGFITDKHCATVRIIIETPALGPGIVFVSQMPDAVVVGPRHKEQMRRYARTAHAFVQVRERAGHRVLG